MKQKYKERIAALAIATGIFAVGFVGGALGFKLNKSPIQKPSITTPSEDPTVDEDPILEQEPSTTLPFLQETFPEVFKPDETIPETTIPEETVQLQKNDIVCATANLNLRTSPSTNGLIIGNLEIYDTVERLAQGPEWSLVKFNEQLAFANNNYLQTTESSVETNVEHKLRNDIVTNGLRRLK